jgi:hypothetical protein
VATHHPVPDRQLTVLDLHAVGAEAALCGEEFLAGGVEPVDLGPPGGQHDHLLSRVTLGVLVGGPPVLEQGQGGGRLGVGSHHPIVGPIGSDGFIDQPVPDQLQGLPLPSLVLPSVLHQLTGPQAQSQGAEATASVDRRQLPVIADQHHLGPGLVGVIQQASELAAADHAGLIDHQYRPVAEGLKAAVEVGQQPVAGGHVLEPLALQAHGGNAGRGGGQEPVAVELPGVAGDAQGEGLARPGPPHHHGNPLAALAQIPDHRPLIRTGGRVRRQGVPHRLMGGHGGLFVHAVGGAGDQPLLHGQQLRGGPAALLERPVGDHADRPLGQEPVRQGLELGPGRAGEAGAEGDQDIRVAEGGGVLGQPVRPGQPIQQPAGRVHGYCPDPVAVRCPASHLPNQGVRVVSALGRLGRQRPYMVPGGSCCLGLRVACTVHLTSRGVRSRPSTTSRSSSASIWPVLLEKPRIRSTCIPLSSRLPWPSAGVHSTPRVRTSWRW